MSESHARQVRVYSGLEGLSEAAAAEIAEVARASVAERGRFSIALSGGNTPKRTYQLLAQRYTDSIDWSRVDVFFGDERFVPPDDNRSNYKMAQDALLSAAPIAADHVHAIPTDTRTVGDAAEAYARTLETVLNGTPAESPVVDLILLGVGPDGHTASLFPGTSALTSEAPVTAVYVPKLDSWRVTLTAPVLSNGDEVVVAAAGAEKADALALALEGAPGSVPIQLVQPRSLTFLVDRAAAAKLSRDA